MKILLFTHKNDIDGMGNAVLAKIAYDNVDYHLCGTFDLVKTVEEYYETKKLYDYDKIFITDLCLEEPLLSKLAKDKKLYNKINILDHHKTYQNEKYTKYPFVKIEIKNENGLCCGTSLFYEYLLNNNLLDKNNKAIKEFVELTRLHDTWEWKTIYNNEKARELALLFDSLGTSGYIEFMYQKLKKEKSFMFNELESTLINNKKLQIEIAIKEYLDNIYYREIKGLKAGILFITYEHRNEIAEYLRENNYDIDFVMMISIDKGVVSYRTVKDNVCVREIAELFGGKGHDKAATNPITKNHKEEIIKILTKIK